MKSEFVKAEFYRMMDEAKAHMQTRPWENRAFYAAWLTQTYYFVMHSTRLLALSSGNATQSQQEMHKRMGKHIGEELSHDLIAKEDLRKLGFQTEQTPEFLSTKAFYRTQYYGIERMDAGYLLGYLLYLEGLAITVAPLIYDTIEKTHGRSSCHFVRVHMEEDPDHTEKALKLMDHLSSDELQLVYESMEFAAKYYKAIVDDSVAYAQTITTQKAPEISL